MFVYASERICAHNCITCIHSTCVTYTGYTQMHRTCSGRKQRQSAQPRKAPAHLIRSIQGPLPAASLHQHPAAPFPYYRNIPPTSLNPAPHNAPRLLNPKPTLPPTSHPTQPCPPITHALPRTPFKATGTTTNRFTPRAKDAQGCHKGKTNTQGRTQDQHPDLKRWRTARLMPLFVCLSASLVVKVGSRAVQEWGWRLGGVQEEIGVLGQALCSERKNVFASLPYRSPIHVFEY